MRAPLARCLIAALLLASRADAGECPAPAPHDRPEAWAGQHAWQALEAAGYRIGAISVEVTDIYESGDAWYAAGANLLHIETRDGVVRDHLLIAPDEPVAARRIYETERKLRSLGIFRAARVVPAGCRDGVVDARVEVADAWTLILSVKANHVGGVSSTGVRLEDRNFLGTGKEVFVERESEATRSTTRYAFKDPALFGSRFTLYASHADQTDGQSNFMTLNLPFYTLEQPWGFELLIDDTTEDLSFYQGGKVAWRADSRNELRTATAWRLIDSAADSGWRLGFGLRSESRGYGAPLAVDPSLRPAPVLDPYAADGVRIAINRFHDHYASFRDVVLVDRIEDYNLGFDGTLSYTFNPEASGNLGEESARWDLAMTWGGRPYPESLLQFELLGAVRDDDGDWRDGYLTSFLSFYDKSLERHTRVARLTLDWRSDPDPEHEVPIGGEFGLLAYRSNEVVGDRAWRLHLEDRIYTDQVLFQTFKVGYSVVLEAGAARRIGTGDWSPVLADLGLGFRIGNLRGAYGQVLYFMVFTPLVEAPGLDRVQFVIGDIISF